MLPIINENQTSSSTIVAKQVPGNRRLRMLPHYFQKHFIATENTVFSFLDQLTADYQGGYWEFYELSNGGFYMAPAGKDIESGFDIVVPFGNGYAGRMSRDAAGILACVMTYSMMAHRTMDELFITLYDKLIEYVDTHPEANQLVQALD